MMKTFYVRTQNLELTVLCTIDLEEKNRVYLSNKLVASNYSDRS